MKNYENKENGRIELNGVECPFCGNKRIELTETEGQYGKSKNVSVSTACYHCHTVKYIALPESEKYLDAKTREPKPEMREKYAEIAVRSWNERPTGTVHVETKKEQEQENPKIDTLPTA